MLRAAIARSTYPSLRRYGAGVPCPSSGSRERPGCENRCGHRSTRGPLPISALTLISARSHLMASGVGRGRACDCGPWTRFEHAMLNAMDNQRPSMNTPRVLLLLLSVVFTIGLHVSGGLKTGRAPDSTDYVALKDVGLQEGLSGYRTIGYPLFLRLVAISSPDLAALPYFQLGLHLAAVFSFLVGLEAVGVSGFPSTIICASLLFSNIAVWATGLVLTDGPGSSLSIMAVGSLMTVVGRRHTRAWFGLAAILFATYQVRPAYLFLIPAVPVLGMIVAAEVMPRADFDRQRRRLALGLAATASIPFLLFCCLRWGVVGQFGLVSFTGTNLIGITGQFLDEAVTARLSPDLAPLARLAIAHRQETPALRIASPGEMSNRSLIEARYVSTHGMFTRLVAESLATSTTENSKSPPYARIDGPLMRLSLEIISARPGLYLMQVLKEFRAGFKTAIWAHDANMIFLLLGCAIPLGRFVSPWHPLRASNGAGSDLGEYRLAARLMFAIAMVFCLAKLTLVVLVEPPIERYMWAAGVFTPSLVGLAVAALWRK